MTAPEDQPAIDRPATDRPATDNPSERHLTASRPPGSNRPVMDCSVGKRPRPASVSEQERLWLERCRQGDDAAFQHLLRPHLTGLLSLARRYCRDPHWAEDLVQETLVRAFKGLPQFRGESALRATSWASHGAWRSSLGQASRRAYVFALLFSTCPRCSSWPFFYPSLPPFAVLGGVSLLTATSL